MSIFSTLRDAKIMDRGSYFPPVRAHYLVEVTACKYQPNRKQEYAFIGEWIVKESTNPDVKPGDRKDFFVARSSDYFGSDVLSFVAAHLGLNADNAADKLVIADMQRRPDHDPMSIASIVEAATDGRRQAFQGLLCRVETEPHTTKQKGATITRQHLRPYYATHEEALAIYRANLAKGAALGAPGAPPPPPPPSPAAADRSTWQRANGYRLNPITNSWELDT